MPRLMGMMKPRTMFGMDVRGGGTDVGAELLGAHLHEHRPIARADAHHEAEAVIFEQGFMRRLRT